MEKGQFTEIIHVELEKSLNYLNCLQTVPVLMQLISKKDEVSFLLFLYFL